MGGIGIGLGSAGYEVVSAYDSWPEAVAVYNHNSSKPVAKEADMPTGGLAATAREG